MLALEPPANGESGQQAQQPNRRSPWTLFNVGNHRLSKVLPLLRGEKFDGTETRFVDQFDTQRSRVLDPECVGVDQLPCRFDILQRLLAAGLDVVDQAVNFFVFSHQSQQLLSVVIDRLFRHGDQRCIGDRFVLGDAKTLPNELLRVGDLVKLLTQRELGATICQKFLFQLADPSHRFPRRNQVSVGFDQRLVAFRVAAIFENFFVLFQMLQLLLNVMLLLFNAQFFILQLLGNLGQIDSALG